MTKEKLAGGFTANIVKFESDTLAERLRTARHDRGRSLPEAAEKLNINQKYLQALEKGAYGDLPSGVYGKNFLREYARFLRLNYEELLKIYEAETAFLTDKEESAVFSRKKAKKRDFLALPKLLRNSLILATVAGCLVYLGWCLKSLTASPELSIIAPAEDTIIDARALTVIGQAEPEVKITVNGEAVLGDNSGQFTKEINLKKGVNTIEIAAEKKFGRKSVVVRQVLVKDEGNL